jgi:hypothetical protein
MNYNIMNYYNYLKQTGDPGRYDRSAEEFKREELKEELKEKEGKEKIIY